MRRVFAGAAGAGKGGEGRGWRRPMAGSLPPYPGIGTNRKVQYRSALHYRASLNKVA